MLQQTVRPRRDDAHLSRDDEHPKGCQECPRRDAHGPRVAPGKAECTGEPAEGEPGQHERHAQPERVGDQHLLTASKCAAAGGQAKHCGQDGGDAGGPSEGKGHAHDRGGPRP